MQKLLVLFFTIIQITALAQLDTSRWTLGVSLGLSRSNCLIKTQATENSLAHTLDSLETGGWYYNFGIRSSCRIAPKLHIITGLEMDTYGHTIDSLKNEQLHSIRYSYANLGMPIGIQRDVFPFKKIQPFIGFLLVPSQLIAQGWSYSEYASNQKRKEKTTMELHHYQLQINALVGTRVPLNARYNFILSVAYQRNMRSLSGFPIERYHQKIGLYLGLSKSI